ncbi:TonB-dependent receptor [Rhodoplanes sp. TEM]|uniref:TonB-dependent receptor n=1 Tax=Rhodoplanes tepidamans TaxID=200616 RepID=A0ABT5JIW9_RHOTP|nr:MULTISPECIES: TonB-dependent receptor [Rhodoplanes]MDC7789654.1 TonB-dependent receptor [Rhodoplanes tepidamans]MDC7987071.1 TonB-dependent receptor [Rhodoplanes sp. TEM]MDQ0353590.1 hemoglobin/transferrin/lactoferrin receptor protein [Rhodoplanes tepidamans]
MAGLSASALAIGWLSGGSALAQTAVQQLPTVEVEGEGQSPAVGPIGGKMPAPKTLHQPTQSITVIDRKEIETTNPTSLLDILQDVPGVSIARAGGIGGQIYLRGFSSNNWRSPMYVDGDRFRGRNTLQLNYFAPEELERVEVIRGPASVIYGSEAMTGLVNVITRRPPVDPFGPWRITHGGFSAGFSSVDKGFSTYEWAQAAGQGFDVLGGVSYRKGGNYDTPSGPALNSDYESVGGNLRVGWSPTRNQRFELALRSYWEEDGRAGGVGGAPGWPTRTVRQQPNQVQMAKLSYAGDFTDQLVQHVEASFYANYYDTKLATVSTSSTTITQQVSHVSGPLVIGGRAQGVIPWEPGPWGLLKTTFGVDGFQEWRPGSTAWSSTTRLSTGVVTYSPETQSGPDSTQANAGAFMLHEWTPLNLLTLSAGGRFDWFNTTSELYPLSSTIKPAAVAALRANSDVTETAPTGSIGATIHVTPILDLLATVGTSYRYPTNSELFAISSTSIPNPELKPEEGVTWEGGFRLNFANATFKATAFESRYRNFLQSVYVTYDGSTFTQTQNVANATVQGVEAEWRWQVTPAFNLSGNVAQLRATNTDTDAPLPYIAPWKGRVAVQYAPPGAGYSVMAAVDWAAAKTRIDASQEYPTGAYAVPSLYASFDLGRLISRDLGDTKLHLGLQNIFDTSYVSASTYATRSYAESMYNPLLEPGRNFTARLVHSF